MQGQSKVEYLRNKIEVLSKLGRETQILKEYDEILRLSGEDAEIRFKKAILLFKLKRVREAAVECEKAIEADSGVPIYHYARALALNRMEDYPESLKEVNEVLRLISSPNARTGRKEHTRNISSEIERLLDHFEAMDPEAKPSEISRENSVPAHFDEATEDADEYSFSSTASRILVKDQNYLDAELTETIDDIKKFDMAMKAIDSHFNTLSSIGKRVDAAISDKEGMLKKLLMQPDDPQIRELIIRFSEVLRIDITGEERKNLKRINRVIDSNPQNPELHYGKALFLYTRGELEEAAREIEISTNLEPMSSAYLFGKTLIENKTIDYEQAIKHLTNAVLENGDSPPAHYKRGIMLYLLKRFGEAVDEFSNAIELYQYDPRYYYGRALSKHNLIDGIL